MIKSVNKGEKTSEQLKNYRDVTGLTTRELDFGLWYVKHRKQFFMMFIVVLALTAAGTIGYSVYQFSHYLLYGARQDKENLLELSSSASLATNKINLGSNVSYSDAMVLAGQNNKVDLVAAVTNANPRLLVNLSYAFEVNGQRTPTVTDFVLPNDTKYLMVLNQSFASSTSASLVVENVTFTRLDRHRINDWDIYRSERFNFLIQNAKFITPLESGLSEKLSVGQLNFTIINQGAYGYKTVPLAIVLKNQGRIVAINRYIINNFRSGETKNIQLGWPGKFPSINEVEVLPDLNIIDDSIYLKYSVL